MAEKFRDLELENKKSNRSVKHLDEPWKFLFYQS